MRHTPNTGYSPIGNVYPVAAHFIVALLVHTITPICPPNINKPVFTSVTNGYHNITTVDSSSIRNDDADYA